MHNGFNGWPFKFTVELYKNLQLLPLCSLGGTYFPIQPKNDKLAICTHSRSSCIFVGHVFITTSWSLLGPRVEVGLMPNIMKGINIFSVNVIKDCSYNYGTIIQMLWKKGGKKKNLFWKCLKWCHVALWNFRLHFEPSSLPPLTKPTIYSKQCKLEKKFRQFFFKVQFVNDKEINVVVNDLSKRRWVILCMSSESPLKMSERGPMF
jgi:hypothetical protein